MAAQGTHDFFAKKAKKKASCGSFQTMSLHPSLMRAIFRKGYHLPTPIQRKVIPEALAGRDVVAMARTGSGKTLSYAVPILQRLKEKEVGLKYPPVRALIISPTRELCQQIYKYIEQLNKASSAGLRIALILGGDQMLYQFEMLSAYPNLIIATPGRLLHLVHETGISLAHVEILVLDEADRLLESGLQTECQTILQQSSLSTRQTLLFSATLPGSLMEFAKVGLKEPALIQLDKERQLPPTLNMAFISVRTEQKSAALLVLLKELIPSPYQAAIFTCSRHHVDYLYELLTQLRFTAVAIHGQLDPSSRKINMAKFRKKKAQFMIVTDLAARGIDIPQLDVIINYDFPDKPKLFIHRVGRTARAGEVGYAYSFVQPDERGYYYELKSVLNLERRSKEQEQQAPPPPQDDGQFVNRYVKPDFSTFLGSIPSSCLSTYSDLVQSALAKDCNLQKLHASAQNAKKLYRTICRKPVPSAVLEGKRRLDGTLGDSHPLFKHLETDSDCGLERFIQTNLKNYRPPQTILETKDEQRHATAAPSDASLAMLRKRALHQSKISKAEHHDLPEVELDTKKTVDFKRSIQPEPSFKDERYFLECLPPSQSSYLSIRDKPVHPNSLEASVLDLTPDCNQDLLKHRSLMKWNRKKRNYVRAEDLPEHKKKLRVKNEAGKLVIVGAKNQGKLYEEWSKASGKTLENPLPPSSRFRETHLLPPMPKIEFDRRKAKHVTNALQSKLRQSKKHKKKGTGRP